MKGIVFTEFIEMMETEIGLLESQALLDSLEFTHDAAYTAVGDYPFQELTMIISKYSEETQGSVSDILETFGGYFAQSLYRQYRVFFDRSSTLFDFLASVHDYIHVEVRKLYPTARPPALSVLDRTDRTMKLHYSSPRSLGAFARGLIYAVAELYQTRIVLTDKVLDESGTEVLFTITVEDDS